MPTLTQKKKSSERVLRIFTEVHRDVLQETNRLYDALTKLRYEGRPSLGRNLKGARKALEFFNQDLSQHVKLEEEILFPFLETHVPKLESVIHLLQAEHRDFKKNLENFEFLLRQFVKRKCKPNCGDVIEKIREIGIYLVYLLRSHAQAESESVYKVIDRELRSDERERLKKQIHNWIPKGNGRR